MDLVVAVYGLTRGFPKEEMFGLTNQLRRAAVSVVSNIAEGKGRLTRPELTHFLGIARGSVLEVQTQLEIARRIGFGSAEQVEVPQQLSVEVLRLLNASLRTLQSKRLGVLRSDL